MAQGDGFPYIKNYKSVDYGGHAQVSSIIRGENGLIYIGTEPGVGIYDGTSWEWITLNHAGQGVRSMMEGKDGIIYVGGTGEFGYLTTDSTGQSVYQSLMNYVPTDYRTFGVIGAICKNETNIFFVVKDYIFSWQPDSQQMKVIIGKGPNHWGTTVGTEAYVRQWGVGLLRIEKEELILVPEGERFGIERIYCILPYDAEHLLIGTRTKGFFLYDGLHFKAFPTALDGYLKKHLLYLPGVKLPNQQFAFGTLGGGVFVMNKDGSLATQLTKERGIAANNIFYQFADNSGNLWLSTSDGISMVAFNTDLRFLDARNGIAGGVFCINQHQDNFYIGTEGGVSIFNKKSNQFQLVENSGVQTFAMLKVADQLFAANHKGVQLIDKNQAIGIKKVKNENSSGLSLHWSKRAKDLLFYGTMGGLNWAKRQSNGEWLEEGIVSDIKLPIYHISEDEEGNFWLSTRNQGVIKASFPNFPNLDNAIIVAVDTAYNLPKDAIVNIVGETIFGFSYEGIFKYEPTSQKFKKQERIIKNATAFQVDKQGHNWTILEKKRGLARSHFEENQMLPKGQQIFWTVQDIQIYYGSLFQNSPAEPVWLGSSEGLIKYVPSIKQKASTNTVFIRKVLMEKDSIVYTGFRAQFSSPLILPYNHNRLALEFAMPSFPKEELVQYQSRLLGLESDWIQWNKRNTREFSRLSTGAYTFQVQAKGFDGKKSPIQTFSIIVLPPWWKTKWAYIGYGLLFLVAMYAVYWLFTQNLKKQLKFQKALQYKALNELQSRFFTNITHEFRTPLTVILGMSDAKEDLPNAMRLIKRNGQKLLYLINQLLDLAKLDTGNLKPNYQQIEIIAFTKYIGESFQSLVDRKNIRLTIYSEIKDLWLDMDEEKYQQIISNLLSNAIKFTPQNGKIVVHVFEKDQCLGIKIIDNGIGIASNELPYIFDRFYQVENSASKVGKGTGIGLALVKELVLLFEGSIEVKSEENQGTVFELQLPIRQPVENRLTQFEAIQLDTLAPITSEAILSTKKRKKELSKILIIEDNTDVIIYIESLLKQQYELYTAADGEKGIRKAIEHIPDLIISDVMMPKKDGFEVVNTLKKDERTSHIPIVLLTAKATQQDKLAGLKYGADAYLMKPFDKEELLLRLKNLLALRQQLQARYTKTTIPQIIIQKEKTLEEVFLEKLNGILEIHAEKSTLNVNEIAGLLRMNYTQFNRKLKALTNQTPTKYLRTFRLEKAKILLKDPTNQLNVSEVAYEVGFTDPNYFSRSFSELFGKSPNVMRKTNSL